MSYKSVWLFFCQLVTFTLGLLFILSTLKPSLFESIINKLEKGDSDKMHLDFIERAITEGKRKDGNPNYKSGFTEAALTAMPSVVSCDWSSRYLFKRRISLPNGTT